MKEEIYMIEALKELPVINDRMSKNCLNMRKYSSGLSNMTPNFKTEAAQIKEVAALLQSTKDLLARYLWLKRCITYTNAVSKIEIDKRVYSVTELIALSQPDKKTRCSMGDYMFNAYDNLSDWEGQIMLGKFNNIQSTQGEAPKIVLFYDEQKKNAERDSWGDFIAKITAKLEIFNARTLLLDPEDNNPIKEE